MKQLFVNATNEKQKGQDVQIPAQDIARVWVEEHNGVEQALIKKHNGAEFTAKDPADSVINTFMQSGQPIFDAMVDGKFVLQSLNNTIPVDSQEDDELVVLRSHASIGGGKKEMIYPLDQSSAPITQTEYESASITLA